MRHVPVYRLFVRGSKTAFTGDRAIDGYDGEAGHSYENNA